MGVNRRIDLDIKMDWFGRKEKDWVGIIYRVRLELKRRIGLGVKTSVIFEKKVGLGWEKRLRLFLRKE